MSHCIITLVCYHFISVVLGAEGACIPVVIVAIAPCMLSELRLVEGHSYCHTVWVKSSGWSIFHTYTCVWTVYARTRTCIELCKWQL